VVTAVRSQNRLVPAGQIGGAPAPPGQQYTHSVQLQGRLTSIADFENLILRTSADGGLRRLRDVGRVTLGGESFDVEASDLRGVPSVGMAIYQLSGSNALEVSRGVKEVLADPLIRAVTLTGSDAAGRSKSGKQGRSAKRATQKPG
jgi:HAE1 family hydrophobic/amphiphilic exporter-1